MDDNIKSQELQSSHELTTIHIRPKTISHLSFELHIIDDHRQTSPLVIRVVAVYVRGVSVSKTL